MWPPERANPKRWRPALATDSSTCVSRTLHYEEPRTNRMLSSLVKVMATKDSFAEKNLAPVDKPKMAPINVWAAPVLIGWVVPGGGHFFLKRTGRGTLILISITLMFVIGLMMRGMMFT